MSDWREHLRLARVRRANGRKYHKPCPHCGGAKTVCRNCGNVICTACDPHECKYASPPRSRARAKAERIKETIPQEFKSFIANCRFKLHDVLPEGDGYTFVFERPMTARSAGDLGDSLRPDIPAGWKVWSVGAVKKGTFYISVLPDTATKPTA
jgi:hypothetical protein